MKPENNRIKFCYYLDGWSHDGGDKADLMKSQKLIPNEFTQAMTNCIFCPVCFTNLSKSPRDKQKFSNGRHGCFVHRPSFSHIDCALRTPKPEGMLYPTEELANQAIAHGKLAIIHSFRDEPPELVGADAEPYDQSAVEDIDGPVSTLAISRHKGEMFQLPSVISTLAGICRKFDDNLYRYYVFPGKTSAILLSSALIDLAEVTEVDEIPRLYFARIDYSRNAGIYPKPTNLRMTSFECNKAVKDFYLKAQAGEQERKGINDDSVGRVVLMWGKIKESGIGLAIEKLKWGEYAVLPERYHGLLYDK